MLVHVTRLSHQNLMTDRFAYCVHSLIIIFEVLVRVQNVGPGHKASKFVLHLRQTKQM